MSRQIWKTTLSREVPKISLLGNTRKPRFQNRDYHKIKKELLQCDGKDHKRTIIWVNKIKGIFKSNSPLGEQEKIMSISNNLEEEETYDWLLQWIGKCDAHSFYWKNFTITSLKRFHGEEEYGLYIKFIHIKQKGNVNDYTREWEVLTTKQTRFTNEKLLKMYIQGLKDYIYSELKLWKHKTIKEARQATKLIEQKNISSKHSLSHLMDDDT